MNSVRAKSGKAVGWAAVILLLTGCVAGQGQRVVAVDAISPSWDQVSRSYDAVDSRASLLEAIAVLERYADERQRDYASRARLANAYTLLGAGYSAGARDKADAYRQAMQWAEAAFMTDGTYRLARMNGKSFEEALQYLDLRHIEALEFWKTAVFYSFREASGILAKLVRYPNLKKAVAVMAREEALDRNAMDGNNLMSWGIYYLAQPEFYGGDREKARAYLAEAAAVSERNIVPRWGRGKYFAVAMNDRDMFVNDLQWVVAQPLEPLDGYRPWNVLIQREAAELLAAREQYFD